MQHGKAGAYGFPFTLVCLMGICIVQPYPNNCCIFICVLHKPNAMASDDFRVDAIKELYIPFGFDRAIHIPEMLINNPLD